MSEGKVYNLLITRGIDRDNQYEFYKERIDNQYEFYKERIDSQRDFLYNEYNTIENELTEELFEKVDVVVLLFGLFNDNKELFKELIAKSKQYNVPLLLIRFFGMEYVLKELGHGVTIFAAKGGFSKEKQNVLFCVIPTKDYFKLKEGIHSIDKEAFFVATDAYEVLGGE